MALDNKQAALRIPHKMAKFWNYVLKRVFNAIVTGLSNFLCLVKQGFSPEFSHISELKGALPPETEARNRKLTVFAMS